MAKQQQRRNRRREDDDASDEAASPKAGADDGDTGTRGVDKKEPAASMASEKKGGVGDVPEDVVISAPVHCDGCARKLRRSLQRLDGVGEVRVNSRTNTVVVSGVAAAENAAAAVEVVERKTGKKAMLLSPSPAKLPFPAAGKKKKSGGTGGGDAGEDGIAEVDTEMVIVLRINLHCDACCEEIKRRILKIEGVKEAAPLLKSSQMVVKGRVEPATLVGFIHRSTGRKAAITRAEPLDLLLPATNSSANSAEKKDGHDREMNDAPAPQHEEEEEENKGGGGGGGNDAGGDEKRRTEKPSEHDDNDGHGVEEGRHETHHSGGGNPTNDGFVLENHRKDDHQLFRAPPPAGVATVAPETTKALNNNFNPYYYPYPSCYSYYPYAHQHHYYQCPMAAPYPYYAYSPAMYGYPNCPPEARPFSEEENPNACAIV